MAEGVISDLLAKALTYLGKAAVKEAASWWGARDDLRKLEETFRMIQARVRDAERHQEDERSDAIREWLRRLRIVLYQADDMFDDVLTVDRQKQRLDVNKQVCVSFSRSGNHRFNWKISGQIKSIRQQLDKINSDIASLNLNAYLGHSDEPQPLRARFIRNRERGSHVREDDVIGREKDKKIITEMLFDDDGKRVSVISIVGFGGLGKTTLAQLVYNDENVQKHFDLAGWACVPEVNNQIQVLRTVCQSLSSEDTSKLSVDRIQSSIQESLKDKKFLLVLEDIWDDERINWLNLLRLLESGADGSKVIVTTRSYKAANAVGTTKFHILEVLTDYESWSLFKKLAFKLGQEESNHIRTQLGKEIVDSCRNVPLAITVIGSLCYTENKEEDWRRIRNDRLSRAKGKEDDNIMQVLKLSYDYLPPALKQCFAYCSLFPKDYNYQKVDLIRLWMAQGYFDPSSTDDIGDQYFMELLRKNLFQDPKEDDEGNVKYCKMHDLVHDLAEGIAGKEIKKLVESLDQIPSTDELMHVGVKMKRPEDDQWEFKAPATLLSARKIRSLLFRVNHLNNALKASSFEMMIMKFQSLRALDLELMNISVVPNSIGKLRHLRYLNLAQNRHIVCLPDGITRLQNLQTLNLESCSSLRELPRDFCELENLRHLAIYGSGLSDLPVGFGKMKSLKYLDYFVVGKNHGADSLPPCPPMVRYIRVDSYKGVEMPRRWLDGLPNLVSICIKKCDECKVLPHLSQLSHLKYLTLENIGGLEYVEDEDWVAHNVYFPSLEELELENLRSLKGWTRPSNCDGGEPRHFLFPRLLKMKIHQCPKLMSMSLASKLVKLFTGRINWKLLESNLTSSSSSTLLTSLELLHILQIDDGLTSLSISSRFSDLKSLSIASCKELESLTIESSYSIQYLEISNCQSLKKVTLGNLLVIKELEISNLKKLTQLPEREEELFQSIACLTTLQKLHIGFMRNLQQLPEEMGNLSLLRELRISSCEEMTSLPQSLLGLTSLQKLDILHCPNLKERYEKPNGQDYHLIQHIPNVDIRPSIYEPESENNSPVWCKWW